MVEPGQTVGDVGDADFEGEVLERSKALPVAVDFWAEWCGPCRQLTPLLERLADENQGEWALVKLDVDRAPVTARRYGIRSVPTVLGFRDGRLVAEFQGAQPETVVKRFLRALLPSEAARAVRSAEELAGGGHVAEATARFREALDLDASHPRALLGLARLLPDRDEALGLLERIVGEPETEREAERLAAELRTRSEHGGDESSWRQRVEADPEDLEARLELGRALAAKGEYEEALGHLLEVVRRKPDYADEAARRAMLDVFSLLGNDDPLTQRFRRELARSLFR